MRTIIFVSLLCALILSFSEGSTIGLKSDREFRQSSFASDLVPQCGISNVQADRIVGGKEAVLGEFPWIARLGYTISPMPGLQWTSWICGGTLINELFILTAAHCFSDDSPLISFIVSYEARIADLNFEDTNDGAKPVQVSIKDIIRHMEYNALTHENDVALVKLAEKVKFTPILLPACLPLGKVKNENLDGMEASIAGWGHTSFEGESPDELLKATISIISEEECKAAYGQSIAVIDNRTLCAECPGKDSCQGDSGGPLTIRIKNKTYLVGIVSWGKGCAEPNYPGVYTKVTAFLSFIKQYIGIEDFSY